MLIILWIKAVDMYRKLRFRGVLLALDPSLRPASHTDGKYLKTRIKC